MVEVKEKAVKKRTQLRDRKKGQQLTKQRGESKEHSTGNIPFFDPRTSSVKRTAL